MDFENPGYYCEKAFFAEQSSQGTSFHSVGLNLAVAAPNITCTCTLGNQTISETGQGMFEFKELIPGQSYTALCNDSKGLVAPCKVVYSRGM